MSYQHIQVQPATKRVGAYLSGFDLNNITNEAVYAEIKQACHEFGVVFMRKQPMSTEAYVRMGSHFGTLDTSHTVFNSEGGPPQIQVITYDPTKPIETQGWHTDNTYYDKPTAFTILQAKVIPPTGGDTLWLSNGALFDDMPKPLQDMLCQLEADHDLFTLAHETNYFEEAGKMDVRAEWLKMEARHPLVIAHPVTGRPQLLVNSHFTKAIRGMHRELGRPILQMINNWAKMPDYQVRLTWEPDTVAIWDNIATQHYATLDYHPFPRKMHRMTVGGLHKPKAYRA